MSAVITTARVEIYKVMANAELIQAATSGKITAPAEMSFVQV